MAFLNEQVLFWTFSTIAQALAALVALSAMVAFYVLGRNRAVLTAAKAQLLGWQKSGAPDKTQRERDALEVAIGKGLWTLDQVPTAVDSVCRFVKSSSVSIRYRQMSKDCDEALRAIRGIQKSLKFWVSLGAIAICLSLVSLPFVSFMVQANVPRWVPIVWLVVVLLAAMTTVIGVAGQFLAWMGYGRESAKKREPSKKTTAKEKTGDVDR